MRPDEHKQKKNAVYKKKHGIQTDKSKGGKPDDAGKRDPKKEKTAGAAAASNFHSDRTARSLSSSSDSEENDEQSVGVEYERKSFSRRKITSNWARYDLPTAEEEESQAAASRGESFEKLLGKAGGAQSHLTLQDEQDWEVGAGEGETRPPCLVLDLGDLAECLQCLPLHHRLGINHDLFSQEQLQVMEEEARQRTEGYTKTTRHTGSSMTLLEAAGEVGTNSEPGTPGKTSSTSVASAKPRDLSLTNVLIKQHHTGPGIAPGSGPPSKTDVAFDGKSATFTAPSVPASSSRSVSSAPSEESVRSSGAASSSVAEGSASVVSAELEDELDELLALDTPAAKPKSQPPQPAQGVKKEASTSVVSTQKSSGAAPASTSKSVTAAKSSSSTAGTEEKLEDWLDSMLGD